MVPRRPLRPVEPRRDGDGARRRRPAREAERAYEWLADIQRPDGSWWNYYLPDGSVEEAKLDTNVCAYIATGVWHHWLCTGDRGFVDHLWPTVERALDWVLSMRRADGTRAVGASSADDTPWDYALLTGSASIAHALRCGAARRAASASRGPTGSTPPTCWPTFVADAPDAFEPKDRWAMDWYYPVLTGALTGEAAKARLADGWDDVRDGGQGHPLRQRRAVGHRVRDGRVRRSRYAAIGDLATATDLLRVDPRPPAATTAPTGPASSTPTQIASRSTSTSAYTGGSGHPRRRRDHRRLAGERPVRHPGRRSPDRLTRVDHISHDVGFRILWQDK